MTHAPKTEPEAVQEPRDARAPSAEKGPSQAPKDTAASLAKEASDFCVSLEKFFRHGFGDMPKSTDLAELRAQQATVQDLVRRSLANGETAAQGLAALTAERDLHKDAAARARADFLNYQTRASKDLQRAEELALRGYASDMLPILDSLDLSLADARAAQADGDRVRAALEMIAQSLQQTLKVRGLERLEVLGKPYDPERHEAAHKRPADAAKHEKPGSVVEELRAGYLWKGLILRAAQVVITHASGQSAEGK